MFNMYVWLSDFFSDIKMLKACSLLKILNVDTFKSLVAYLLHIDGTVLWRSKMTFFDELWSCKCGLWLFNSDYVDLDFFLRYLGTFSISVMISYYTWVNTQKSFVEFMKTAWQTWMPCILKNFKTSFIIFFFKTLILRIAE